MECELSQMTQFASCSSSPAEEEKPSQTSRSSPVSRLVSIQSIDEQSEPSYNPKSFTSGTSDLSGRMRACPSLPMSHISTGVLGFAPDPFLRNWMAELPDGILLSSLKIPGTHDSATFQIKMRFLPRYVEAASKCQVRNFIGQLEMGVRFLDLRVSPNKMLMHGAISCGIDLQTAATDCCEFLTAHPTEAIIVRLKREGDLPCTRKAARFDQILDELHRALPAKVHLSQRLPILGDVRGKIWVIREWDALRDADGDSSEDENDEFEEGVDDPGKLTATMLWGNKMIRLHDVFAHGDAASKFQAISEKLMPLQLIFRKREERLQKAAREKRLRRSASDSAGDMPGARSINNLASFDERDKRLRIVFTSGTGLAGLKNPCLMPADVALFVNSKLAESLYGDDNENLGLKLGIVAMDFPSPLLCKLIVLRNFRDRRPSQEEDFEIALESPEGTAVWTEAPPVVDRGWTSLMCAGFRRVLAVCFRFEK